MTSLQDFMLATCFGVCAGLVIGSWIIIIKNLIELRRLKKEAKEKSQEE